MHFPYNNLDFKLNAFLVLHRIITNSKNNANSFNTIPQSLFRLLLLNYRTIQTWLPISHNCADNASAARQQTYTIQIKETKKYEKYIQLLCYTLLIGDCVGNNRDWFVSLLLNHTWVWLFFSFVGWTPIFDQRR